jgi:predicted MFS family arabinose efflux permease
VSRALDAISPPRLGGTFRRLLASSWVSNLGDGLSLAAGPLLVASQTKDPIVVAAAAFLQRLPWLMFGLFAGVVADRVDRRLVVVVADSTRVAVLLTLAVSCLTDSLHIWVILLCMLLLGTAETFADITSSAILPMVVASGDLGIANSRLVSGYITANQLIGPPIGAVLFTAGRASPFIGAAVLMGAGASLMWRVTGTRPTEGTSKEPVRQQILEGMRWLWHHPPVRTLALTIVSFNVTFGAAWSVLVLYAKQRLGLDDLGFGLLTTMSAVGGVGGTIVYARIEARWSLAGIMRTGLIIETFTHLALAVTRSQVAAMVVFVAFGAHAAIWATTSTSVRQRAVPTEVQGRVGSVYMIGVQLGLLIGTGIGGAIAQRWGVTAPFWFAFVGSALILATIWRSLRHIAHAE